MLEKLKGNSRKTLLGMTDFLWGAGLIYYALHRINRWSFAAFDIFYFMLAILAMKAIVRIYYYFRGSMPENRQKERLVIILNLLLILALAIAIYADTMIGSNTVRNAFVFFVMLLAIVYFISEHIERKIVN